MTACTSCRSRPKTTKIPHHVQGPRGVVAVHHRRVVRCPVAPPTAQATPPDLRRHPAGVLRRDAEGNGGWDDLPDLRNLLEQNFVSDLQGRYLVPDPKKAEDLEQLREREAAHIQELPGSPRAADPIPWGGGQGRVQGCVVEAGLRYDVAVGKRLRRRCSRRTRTSCTTSVTRRSSPEHDDYGR